MSRLSIFTVTAALCGTVAFLSTTPASADPGLLGWAGDRVGLGAITRPIDDLNRKIIERSSDASVWSQMNQSPWVGEFRAAPGGSGGYPPPPPPAPNYYGGSDGGGYYPPPPPVYPAPVGYYAPPPPLVYSPGPVGNYAPPIMAMRPMPPYVVYRRF